MVTFLKLKLLKCKLLCKCAT